MPNQPIPIGLANEMIIDYVAYMEGLGVDMKDQTQSLSFSSGLLKLWMDDVMMYPVDEFRIFMGRYPKNHQYEGRTTVIVWPYNEGHPAVKSDPGKGNAGGEEEIEPFNEGGLNP